MVFCHLRLRGPGQTLQSVFRSAGISTSGTKAGLCELTWAHRTTDGRFWMPPPRRGAKVTLFRPYWSSPPSLGFTLCPGLSILYRGRQQQKATEGSPSLEGTMELNQKYFQRTLPILILPGSGCYLNEWLPRAHTTVVNAVEALARARQKGKEPTFCQQ